MLLLDENRKKPSDLTTRRELKILLQEGEDERIIYHGFIRAVVNQDNEELEVDDED